MQRDRLTPGGAAVAGVAVLGAAVLGTALVIALGIVALSDNSRPVLAEGVGAASWTPSESTTTVEPSDLLTTGDSFTVRTDATWDGEQADGLAHYLSDGLRYTHEVNDRAGRLSATGFWATNQPDPAYDRDDDDGDGRWEEAEITAGAVPPEPGRTYSTLIQFSRWFAKRQAGTCEWAWDRRLGQSEILSQLSREFLGEWQAEHYTLGYDTFDYGRVGLRPELPADAPLPHCGDARPAAGQSGIVVTFSRPLSWAEFLALPAARQGRWTAFEAIGRSQQDELPWTCGGPVTAGLAMAPCRKMGVTTDGVVAAVGYFGGDVAARLQDSPDVARVTQLQDVVTGLLFDVGGFGVVRPGLTVNDDYWELSLAGR